MRVGHIHQRRNRTQPTARGRFCTQAGDGPRSSRRGSAAPRTNGAAPACDRGGDRRIGPATGAISGVTTLAKPAAARSRDPATPLRSPRLGIGVSVAGSSSPSTAATGAPTGISPGQFDDAVMVLAELRLARRHNIPLKLAPDRPAFSSSPLAGMIAPDRREHRLHAGPRSALLNDHEPLPRQSTMHPDLELVGIGMARRGAHMRHAERGQLTALVLRSHFRPDAGEGGEDLVQNASVTSAPSATVGEFHRISPPASEGAAPTRQP